MLLLTQLLPEALASSLKANSSLNSKNYYLQTALEIFFFPPPVPQTCPYKSTISFSVFFLSGSVFLSQGQEESCSSSADVSKVQCFPSLMEIAFTFPVGFS